jgi:hypothetical protein
LTASAVMELMWWMPLRSFIARNYYPPRKAFVPA